MSDPNQDGGSFFDPSLGFWGNMQAWWNQITSGPSTVGSIYQAATSGGASQALDEQLIAQNQANVLSGLWTQQQADQANANIAAGNASTGATSPVGALLDAAGSGAAAGFQNMAQGAGNLTSNTLNTLAKSLGAFFGQLPIWFFVVAALVLLFLWKNGGYNKVVKRVTG